MRDLESLKSAGTIKDYNLFAYDWRRSVEDTVENGTLNYDEETRFAVAELRSLAENSKNKKVAIIAHSMGGLLAKAIMLELAKTNETGIVDKIVFVGTPQMGTPMSIFSLLYGYDEATPLDILISQSDAREFAENMPGAYSLLPSKEYFGRTEGNPFITFSSERTPYKSFKDAYGEGIADIAEFQKFLTGEDDGREKPNKDDVELENVLRKNIFDAAMATHERLDSWTPPPGVKVIEIAGWGRDTISGVDYTEKEKTQCYAVPGVKVPSCDGMDEYEPVYEPKFTVDGDKVVVSPSALMMESESESVEKYWVDLWSYDDILTTQREHGGILEVSDVGQFLTNIITNTYITEPLPGNVKDNRPNPEG
jgi:pimeloyl-ACP methyl ester carboxylesterase